MKLSKSWYLNELEVFNQFLLSGTCFLTYNFALLKMIAQCLNKFSNLVLRNMLVFLNSHRHSCLLACAMVQSKENQLHYHHSGEYQPGVFFRKSTFSCSNDHLGHTQGIAKCARHVPIKA